MKPPYDASYQPKSFSQNVVRNGNSGGDYQADERPSRTARGKIMCLLCGIASSSGELVEARFAISSAGINQMELDLRADFSEFGNLKLTAECLEPSRKQPRSGNSFPARLNGLTVLSVKSVVHFQQCRRPTLHQGTLKFQ